MSDSFFRNIKLLLRGNSSTLLDSAGACENLLKKCRKCNQTYNANEIVNTIVDCKLKTSICFSCLVKINNDRE